MATKYYPVKIDLSAMDTRRKLARGGTISAHKGAHIVHVTKTQKTALAKAHKAGKGLSLKLSKSALDHNRLHNGGGIFGDILKTVASAALPYAASALTNLTGSKAVGDIAQGVGGAAIKYLGGGGLGGRGFKGPGY